MNQGRIDLRSGQQRLRVGGKRISQAGNIELAIVHLLLGNDDARLGLQSRHIGLPALRAAAGRARVSGLTSRTAEISNTGPPAESCSGRVRCARSIHVSGASPSATMRSLSSESRTVCRRCQRRREPLQHEFAVQGSDRVAIAHGREPGRRLFRITEPADRRQAGLSGRKYRIARRLSFVRRR